MVIGGWGGGVGQKSPSPKNQEVLRDRFIFLIIQLNFQVLLSISGVEYSCKPVLLFVSLTPFFILFSSLTRIRPPALRPRFSCCTGPCRCRAKRPPPGRTACAPICRSPCGDWRATVRTSNPRLSAWHCRRPRPRGPPRRPCPSRQKWPRLQLPRLLQTLLLLPLLLRLMAPRSTRPN